MAKRDSSKASSKFRFRKNYNIGVSDAEQDGNFLYDCFVDTGEIDILRNASDRRRIVLGRTGAGKTALLMEFQKEEASRVISIKPESLALNYKTSSILYWTLG